MVNTEIIKVVPCYEKSKQLMGSIARSASCSRGWLRLIVEGIFGIIIVSSFILILLMALGTSYKNHLKGPQRCITESCAVICNDAPFFGEYEDQVLHALQHTEPDCRRVFLTLNNPMFMNCSLTGQWLSEIRITVNELEIIGGNLQHIPSGIFMTQFGGNLRVLVLDNITINTLAADTFHGLTALQELYIKNCVIINIRQNALQAVDNTLQTLKINCKSHWNPVNVTGFSNFAQLQNVDFSNNEFNDILGPNSFTELKACRVLKLNLCKITAIKAGTFDNLKKIEILHLHDNLLVSLPSNIFRKIISLKPRISLQKNLWECNCLNHNLRTLIRLNLIMVDPICQNPISYRGVTFSEFDKHCTNNSSFQIIYEDLPTFDRNKNNIFNADCESDLSADNFSFQIHSPVPEYQCNSNKIVRSTETYKSIDNVWFKPILSVDTYGFSMLCLAFTGTYDYGLIWYKSSCPHEIYCINHVPNSLRVYNKDPDIEYIFCLVTFNFEIIKSDSCVIYNQAKVQTVTFYTSVFLFVGIAFVCLLSGALCIYALIQKNPTLLKGNKRLVFVKHKTVDALILPPKLFLKQNMPVESNMNVDNNNIFVIPEKKRRSENFMRTNSVRTIESNDHSYISALHPTEDQLAEWRTMRQFEVKHTPDLTESNMSNRTGALFSNSLPFYSLDSTEQIYDTIKL